jgi:2-oxoisovalerate dehydrogenase E1 component
MSRVVECGLLSAAEMEAKSQAITEEVYATFQEVMAEPEPQAPAALGDRLAPPPDTPPVRLPDGFADRKWSMVRAVNVALQAVFENDEGCTLFGEDVDDPKGGVFGLTRGLGTRFPGRVHNSPLAEATIAGVAAGLASAGGRPFIEMQFVDFTGPAMSQIVNDLATLRWRSAGGWTCPVVMYAPYGSYVAGAGIWHSQACEGAFTQVPGLRVMVPSNPADAVGMFWTAAHADDPTVILIPKRLFPVAEPVPETVAPVPFGTAARLCEGGELTVVAWGNTVRVAREALALAGDAVSADLFDLRGLMPWDKEAILASVVKTGRLLVVH